MTEPISHGMWIDLSHAVYPGMPHSEPHGDVAIWVDELVRTQGTFRITHLQMATHIGTHIDAPCHYIEGGKSIDQYPTSRFIGPGVALDLRREGAVAVTVEDLETATPRIQDGDIVFMHFGYAERYGKSAWVGHPFLSEDAARWLVAHGIPLVGVDVLTPDLPEGFRPEGFGWPVHRILLGADVLVLENLGPRIAQVTGHRLDVFAVPMTITGADAAPVVPLVRVTD